MAFAALLRQGVIMKNLLSVMSIILLTLCLFPTGLFAIMEGLSTERLTKSSNIVIEGDVKNVKAYWSNDRRSIFTRAVITGTYVIKGKENHKQVVVEHEGGEIGSIGFRVSDVSPLNTGERVILFLKTGKSKKEGNAFHIVGKGQGKYRIGNDGIARKSGFAIVSGQEFIDNNIPADTLIEKIRKVK